MAVNFSDLLRKPTGSAKKPPVLPAGLYPCIVKSFEYAELYGNQKIPGVRYIVVPMEWPEAVDAQERDGIELQKRQLRKEFSVQDADIWMLEAFLASCGLADGSSTDEENIPKVVGMHIMADVLVKINQNTSEPVNNVGKVFGQSS